MTKFLVEHFRNDLIFSYANKTSYPSYGWFLQQGYTSWPEEWDVKDAPQESKMHGCYNSIGLWFMKGVLGIRQSPLQGFPSPNRPSKQSQILLRSGFDCGDVTWSSGSLDTVFGTVQSSWKIENSVLQHNVTVPFNSVALVQIPGIGLLNITESGIPALKAVGLEFLGTEIQLRTTVFHFQVVSGKYVFVSQL